MQSYFNLDEESSIAKIQMEGAQIFLINLSQNAQGSSPWKYCKQKPIFNWSLQDNGRNWSRDTGSRK